MCVLVEWSATQPNAGAVPCRVMPPTSANQAPATGFSLPDATAVLERTPPTLTAMLTGLPDEWLHTTEGPYTFSPFAVVGHLIDAERSNWLVRARQVLASAAKPLPAFDRYQHRERDTGRSLTELLAEFTTLRTLNLAVLRDWSLTDEQLALPATHPALGDTTLAELLAAWVVHDLGHVAQVARVMAKRYAEAIGPWRRFLPIVDDRPTPVT